MIATLFFLAWFSASCLISAFALLVYRTLCNVSITASARIASFQLPQEDRWYSDTCQQEEQFRQLARLKASARG